MFNNQADLVYPLWGDTSELTEDFNGIDKNGIIFHDSLGYFI